MILILLQACAQCGVTQESLDAELDWRGSTDAGVAIGCRCECGPLVTCYMFDDECPTGVAEDPEGDRAFTLLGHPAYTLDATQLEELRDVCGTKTDTGCPDTVG